MINQTQLKELLLTQTQLKELLHYDKDTGVFTWLVSRGCVKAGAVAGYIDSNGYRQIGINGTDYQAHRLAWLYVHGEWPPNDIDHEKHNRADNRIVKLRLATTVEQNKNKGKYKCNTSGHTGVCWDKRASKWLAQIAVDGKQIYLGLFENKQDAIDARQAANIKYNFHKNHGRR